MSAIQSLYISLFRRKKNVLSFFSFSFFLSFFCSFSYSCIFSCCQNSARSSSLFFQNSPFFLSLKGKRPQRIIELTPTVFQACLYYFQAYSSVWRFRYFDSWFIPETTINFLLSWLSIKPVHGTTIELWPIRLFLISRGQFHQIGRDRVSDV